MNAPLLHLLFQNARHIGVRLAAVDHQRQARLARRRDVDAKALRLRRARAQVIVIVQPRLADAHHLGMLGELHKLARP